MEEEDEVFEHLRKRHNRTGRKEYKRRERMENRKNRHQRRVNRRKQYRLELDKDKKKVYQRFGRLCYLCGKAGANTIDHIIPLIKGGTNDISNLRPAHEECNKEKGKKIVVLPIELEESGW